MQTMKALQMDQVEEHDGKFFTDVCEKIRALRPNLPSFEQSIKNASDEPQQQKGNRLAYLGILLKETGDKYPLRSLCIASRRVISCSSVS